jgi:hypothetical protein
MDLDMLDSRRPESLLGTADGLHLSECGGEIGGMVAP